MKNRELIEHINGLSALKERAKGEKILSPIAMLYVSRNLRTMANEYNTHYVKDLEEVKAKYLEHKQIDVTIPATETEPEHVEKRVQDVFRQGANHEDFEREINTLLDMDVNVPICKVGVDAITALVEMDDVDAIEFMVE